MVFSLSLSQIRNFDMIKRLVCFAVVLAFGTTASAQYRQLQYAAMMTHDANTVRYASQDRVSQYFLNNGAYGTGCNNFGLTGNKVWSNWVTSGNEIEFGGSNANSDTNGVQVGADIFSNKTTLVGLVGGYGYTEYEADGVKYDIDAKDYYFGIYGAKLFSNCVDMRLCAGYGAQKYSPFNLDTVKGKTFETTLEFGRRYYMNRCWSFRPFAGLDWFTNNAQERGWNHELTQVMGRIGSDVQYTRDCWNLNGGLHYAYQLNENAMYNLASNAYNFDLGRSVLTFNAGTTVYLDKCKKWSLFATYYGDCYADRDNTPWRHTGMVGAGYRF